MKYIKQSLFAFSAIGISIIWNGCTSSFDDLNTNPDATTKVTPALLATKVQVATIMNSCANACSGENKWIIINTIVWKKGASAPYRDLPMHRKWLN